MDMEVHDGFEEGGILKVAAMYSISIGGVVSSINKLGGLRNGLFRGVFLKSFDNSVAKLRMMQVYKKYYPIPSMRKLLVPLDGELLVLLGERDVDLWGMYAPSPVTSAPESKTKKINSAVLDYDSLADALAMELIAEEQGANEKAAGLVAACLEKARIQKAVKARKLEFMVRKAKREPMETLADANLKCAVVKKKTDADSEAAILRRRMDAEFEAAILQRRIELEDLAELEALRVVQEQIDEKESRETRIALMRVQESLENTQFLMDCADFEKMVIYCTDDTMSLPKSYNGDATTLVVSQADLRGSECLVCMDSKAEYCSPSCGHLLYCGACRFSEGCVSFRDKCILCSASTVGCHDAELMIERIAIGLPVFFCSQ